MFALPQATKTSKMEEPEKLTLLSESTITPTRIPENSNTKANDHRMSANDELDDSPVGARELIVEPDTSSTRPGEQQEQSAHEGNHEKPRRARIGYRVEIKDPLTDEILSRRTYRAPVAEDSLLENLDEPIFEHVTTYKARRSTDKASATSNAEKEDGPDLLEALGPTRSYGIVIHSAAIINALRAVVSYYPSQDLSGDSVRIAWPYRVLVHHYDELVEFKKEVTLKSPEDLCVRERDAVEHLDVLIQFLDDSVMVDIRAEAERSKKGFVTYENLWYHYRPGCAVVTNYLEDDESQWRTYVVQDIEGGPTPERSESWHIMGWTLNFDGTYLNRIRTGQIFDIFTGEENWDTLNRLIYDKMSLDDEQARKRIDTGRRYWELIQKQCQYYKGKSCNFPYNEVSTPIQVYIVFKVHNRACNIQQDDIATNQPITHGFQQIDGLVMTDVKQFYTDSPHRNLKFMDRTDLGVWTSDCTCHACKQGKGTTRRTRDDWSTFILMSTQSELDPADYLLCPGEIQAFVFRTRAWGESTDSFLLNFS